MKRLVRVTLVVAAWSAGMTHSAHAQTATAVAGAAMQCSLLASGGVYSGSCDVPCPVNELAVNFKGVKPGFSCDAPPRRVAVNLRSVGSTGAWLGDMPGRQPEDPTRFELLTNRAGGGAGVAKTPFGWFALTKAEQTGDQLSLVMATDKQLPPTADDLKILRRSAELLVNNSVWNKADNRQCPPNPTRWSMFCALMQATEEVSGGVHYRQPALQAVRETLNDVGGNRMGKHRLMDYNNHPDTTLDEIHQLLKKAQARLEPSMSR
jgi:hypothetical protein